VCDFKNQLKYFIIKVTTCNLRVDNAKSSVTHLAEIYANEEKPIVPEFPEQVMSKDRQIKVIKKSKNQ